MAFTTSAGVPSIGYSGSALRYGLMDIKPVEVVETIKRFGLKFRKVTRTFQSLKPSRSYEDLVTFENEAIFRTIEIPKWFDADKLVKTFSQHAIESYEKDTELKEAVENVRKAKRKGRPLLSFTQYIKHRFESEREHYLELEARRFLDSNFPLTFYNKLVVFDNTYYDFIKILEDRVRIYEFRASCSRNFRMYEKKLAEMKKHLGPIIDQTDNCFFSYSRLKKYVITWNSKNYEKIHEPKFLDLNNVDSSEFEKLRNDYYAKLGETRRFLLRYNPEILHKEFDPKEPTINMFRKLVMLPSDSLSLTR